ncbi:MAG: 3-dehydroquinate synthase [Clostridia bacterium]|nr:3-dehydroquinate synthase [Clostridia bacterium]
MKLDVKTKEHSYDIIIGKGILKNCASYIVNTGKSPAKILIVTDENVAQFYGDTVCESLKTIAEVKLVVLPAGETTKSLGYLSDLYDEAFSFGMTRTDLAVALGGGVIGDLTGFFASTVLRGIDVVQIPTTLLSQVDSSVGGKTAIDVSWGKNLVGTFYQPSLVIADTATLDTLPDEEFSSGLAEVIKYGCIWDKDFFDKINSAADRKGLMKIIDEIVYTCCDIKRQVVEQDELDTALRMILNFGHTAGHIVEKAYNYTGYTHGEAVAFGMIIAARLGERLGITEEGTTKRIEETIKKFQLPYDIKITHEALSGITLDKKTSGNSISVILLDKIGKFNMHKMSTTEYVELLKEIW